MHSSRIVGWGSALPDQVVTNHDLARYLDTNHEWVVTRTGIHERRIGGTTTELAVAAAKNALTAANLEASDIDALVLATCTPDQTMPAVAVNVLKALGRDDAAGFDVNAACAGFGFGLITGFSLVDPQMGTHRVMVIGADRMSTITDQQDRGTAILFADGAGAVIIEASEGTPALLGYDWGVTASQRDHLVCELGGCMVMDGHEVFTAAVVATAESCLRTLRRAGMEIDDVTLLVPHQANLRIIRSAIHRLGMPEEKVSIVLDTTGNTSSGSIPIALTSAIEDGRVKPDDLILFCGFGAGMSWASALVRWDADPTL